MQCECGPEKCQQLNGLGVLCSAGVTSVLLPAGQSTPPHPKGLDTRAQISWSCLSKNLTLNMEILPLIFVAQHVCKLTLSLAF